MNYESTKHKIRTVNNETKNNSNNISILEISEIAEDKKLDIKELLVGKRIINLSSGLLNTILVPNEDESWDAGAYCNYEIELINCPIYLLPYIKIAAIGQNTEAFENYSYIQIINAEENEEMVNKDMGMEPLEKTVKIFCGALTASTEGIKIKFLINITNPKEFR